MILVTAGSVMAAYPYSQINSDGFGDANNTMVNALAYFNGYLYAGTNNSNAGAQIWRTADDSNWEKVVDNGLTGATVTRVQYLIVFNSYLYAGTADSTHGGEVWRSANGTDWEQVGSDGMGSAANQTMHTGTVFDGYLYFSTINSNGAQIWRSANGTDWEQANTAGFGKAQNSGIYGIYAFNSYIYAGTYNPAQGAELWRSANGTDWELVFDGGNGNINDRSINGFGSSDGYMIVTTWNNNDGSRVWRTTDGQNFIEVTNDGFGDTGNVNLPRVIDLCHEVYTGSSNVTGAELWGIDPITGDTEQIVGDDSIPGGFGAENNYIASIYASEDSLYTGMNYSGKVFKITSLCPAEQPPEEEIIPVDDVNPTVNSDTDNTAGESVATLPVSGSERDNLILSFVIASCSTFAYFSYMRWSRL